MAYCITSDSANNLFLRGYYEITKDTGTNELCDVVMELTDPTESIVSIPEVKLSPEDMTAELLRHIGTNESGSYLGYYCFPAMDVVLPTEEEFKPITDYYFRNSQYDYIIETLTEDPVSNNAVININGIYHKASKEKPFPNILGLQFRVRENLLYLTVTMCSMDIVDEFPRICFVLSVFQSMVLNELKKTYPEYGYGNLTFFVSSLCCQEETQKYTSGVQKTDTVLEELKKFHLYTYHDFHKE